MEELLKLKQTLDELVELIEKNDCPGKNDRILTRVRFLAAQMAGRDSYISEKAGRIASQAAVFYSAKSERDPSAARELLTEISYDLPSRIRAQIATLQEYARKRDED